MLFHEVFATKSPSNLPHPKELFFHTISRSQQKKKQKGRISTIKTHL